MAHALSVPRRQSADALRQVRGRHRWSAGAESIHFLNTPQIAEPNSNLVSPSFGAITNILNDGRTFRFRLRVQF